ncbi:MAG TPA: OmpW family outer membrane protein [Steroidobacteraceae bacterium]|jgi:outer membrane protein|nr:OmpW family outer membrane protein [Steroidobacteraceae bacterium]
MNASPNTALVLCIGLSLALGMAAMVARADDDTGAGDHPNLVAIGLYQVSFHVHADDISGLYVPPGLNVRNPSVTTLYLGYMRRLSPHFDLELALGLPPLTRTVARGPATVGSVPYNGQTIATARWLAPSLLVKYYLFRPDALLRPYVGIGVNYTRFYSRQVTAAGDAISGGPTSLSLPASTGPVGTIGVSWRALDRVVVNLSGSASWVNARLTTNTAAVLRTSHVEFNPRAIVLAVGYRF